MNKSDRDELYEEFLDNYYNSDFPSVVKAPASNLFLTILHRAATFYFPVTFTIQDHDLIRSSGTKPKRFHFIRKILASVLVDGVSLVKYSQARDATEYSIKYRLLKNEHAGDTAIIGDAKVLEEMGYVPLSHYQETMITSLVLMLGSQHRPYSNPNHGLLSKIRTELDEENPRCAVCDRFGDLLHHKHYKSWRNEKSKDLIILCTRCHSLIHKPYSKVW